MTAVAVGIGIGGSSCVGLGVGIAGVLNSDGGVIIEGMTNLPMLIGVPLARRLEAAFNLPVRIENDAQTGMVGEARFGAARAKREAPSWHCSRNAHVLLDLEIVLLSGGMTRMGLELVAGVRQTLEQHCPRDLGDDLLIELGEWADAIGAVCLWLARRNAMTSVAS